MKILIYVDPSFRGEWALSLARDLARGLKSTVVLLTTESNIQEHPDLLDRAAGELAGGEDLAIEQRWRAGSAREAIVAESMEIRPVITVFPPAGRSALGRMIKGSRVKTVVHKTPSTIMVARKPVSNRIHNILVTVRGGPFSETLLLCAQEIASAVQAEITVLHVTSGVTIPLVDGEKKTERPDTTAASDPLDEIVARLGLEGKVRTRDGMVINEILAECRGGHYDLLVLGQHLADKEPGGPLSENLAEILTMECPIPVLMVRPRLWITGGSPAAPAPGGTR